MLSFPSSASPIGHVDCKPRLKFKRSFANRVNRPFQNIHFQYQQNYGGQSTKKEWSAEIEAEYSNMYNRAAFVLWRGRHERLSPLRRASSPLLHHTAPQIEAAMLDTDFRENRTRLLDDYITAQGFPLLILGQHDDVEYCLVPVSNVI